MSWIFVEHKAKIILKSLNLICDVKAIILGLLFFIYAPKNGFFFNWRLTDERIGETKRPNKSGTGSEYSSNKHDY